jgi:hypothetical protein
MRRKSKAPATRNVYISADKKRGEHVPHWVARQAPENIPLLLVANRCASDRDGVCVNNCREPHETRVLGVDGAREPEIACGVLVSDVRDRVVGERRAHQLERGVHLRTDALKEHTAATDEECVPSEDRTCIRGRGCVGHIVADRVARMARRREAPRYIAITLSVLAREKENELHVERFTNGESVLVSDDVGQSGAFMTPTVHWHTRE